MKNITKPEKVTPNKDIKLLVDIGFEKVGYWNIVNKAIDYQLSKFASSKGILYAFVANNRVLYIGKTVRTLNQRMYGYKNPGPTQKTNIKNNQNIESDQCVCGFNCQSYWFCKVKICCGFWIFICWDVQAGDVNSIAPILS